MPKQAEMKCMRCGHQYTVPAEKAELEERVCPRCRSNSVRLIEKE